MSSSSDKSDHCKNNVILIKGNVPGPKKSLVMIRTSVKKGEKINEMEELITYEVVEEPTEEAVEEEKTEQENVTEGSTEDAPVAEGSSEEVSE